MAAWPDAIGARAPGTARRERIGGPSAAAMGIGSAIVAAVSLCILSGSAAMAEESPRRVRAQEQRAEELLAKLHATWRPSFSMALMISSMAPPPLEQGGKSLRFVAFMASHGDRWAAAAPAKHAQVGELAALGEAATSVCNRALAAAKSADADMERLAALLGLLGNRESVPILIGALARATRSDKGHAPYAAATWALWRLTGRKLVQTSGEWKRWWQAVGSSFRLPRNRIGLRVEAKQVEGLVRELAAAETPVLARERLIVLGPSAVPHLLKAAAGASGDVQYHLAWVIDELGAAARLPRKVRHAYFVRRLGKAEDEKDTRCLLLDSDAHRRSLTNQSFADFCRFALASRRHANRAGADADFRSALKGESADIPGAAGVLVEALGHRDKPVRQRAAELAGFIGRFSTARPSRLIDALLARWRAEPGDYVMIDALRRFDTPAVRAAIREGLESQRLEVLRDCTRAVRDTGRLPGPEEAQIGARLVELTHHQDARLRQYSTEVLAAHVPALLAPHLERLARDREVWTRAACARAMGKLKRPTDSKLLVELAKDRQSCVYNAAFKAVGDPAFRGALAELSAILRNPRYQYNDPCMWAIANIGGPEAAAVLIQHAAEGNTLGRTIFNALEKVTGRKFGSAREAMAWWWSFPYRPAAPSPERLSAQQLAALWKHLASGSPLAGYQATQAMVSGGDAAVELLAGKLKALRTPADRVQRLIADLGAADWATRNRATERLAVLGPAAEPALRAAMKAEPSGEVKARAKTLLAACALPYPSRPAACRAARAVRVLERIGTDRSVALLKELAAGQADDHLSTQARAALRRIAKSR